MSHLIGIDLGASHASVAYMQQEPILIPIEGQVLIPSVVAFTDAETVLIGESARKQALLNPANTIVFVKKLMGKRFSDLENSLSLFPFSIAPDKDGFPLIKTAYGDYTPEEISAYLLRHLADGAGQFLGESISKCVITVPANFDAAELAATREACLLAGLQPIRFVREPAAACMAYAFHQRTAPEKKILIFDLGGSSVDVSAMEVGGNESLGYGVFEVKATTGDNFLGGINFDKTIADLLAQQFLDQTGFDIRTDRYLWYRLMDASEKAKIELSASLHTDVYLPFISIKGQIVDLKTTLSRSVLEETCTPLMERCVELCKEAIEGAGWSMEEIEELVLVGAATRMPFLKTKIQTFLAQTARYQLQPEEMVAMGAAIQGGILSGSPDLKNALLLDAIPHGLGLHSTESKIFEKEDPGQAKQNVLLVDEYATIPIKKSQTFVVPEGCLKITLDIVAYKRDGLKKIGNITFDTPVGTYEISFDMDANGLLNVFVKTDQTHRFEIITKGSIQTEKHQNIREKFQERQRVATQYDQIKRFCNSKNISPLQLLNAEKELHAIEFWLLHGKSNLTSSHWETLENLWQLVAQQVHLNWQAPPMGIPAEQHYKANLVLDLKQHINALLERGEKLGRIVQPIVQYIPIQEFQSLQSSISNLLRTYNEQKMTYESFVVEQNRKIEALFFFIESLTHMPNVHWKQLHKTALTFQEWLHTNNDQQHSQ